MWVALPSHPIKCSCVWFVLREGKKKPLRNEILYMTAC